MDKLPFYSSYERDLDLPTLEVKRAQAYAQAMQTAGLGGSGGSALKLWFDALERAPQRSTAVKDYRGPEVCLGTADELSVDERVRLLEALRAFRPWKKGPFRIFGETIDAEWRSDLKWQRLQPWLPSLAGKRIADIGCHNGYYMFRMAAEAPECVIGFEPVAKHLLTFQLLQRYAQESSLQFEALGVEGIDIFSGFFDVVFCLGILYHHQDPIGILRRIRSSMRPKAKLFVDCQGIDHPLPVALVPEGKYCGTRGNWFLPSPSCLLNWLKRAGFVDVKLIYRDYLSVDEQRATAWAPIRSLEDFLAPNPESKQTIEGYPAPYRIYAMASRGS